MRKRVKFWLAAALCALPLLAAFACGATPSGTGTGTGGTGGKAVAPPAAVHRVTGITIRYRDLNVTNGKIEVDLSDGAIVLSADVQKTDESADGAAAFYSGDPSVASVVAATGAVTLKKQGETVITATAGGKSHQVVLIVADAYSAPAAYGITVVGGTAKADGAAVAAAAAGTLIALAAVVPDGMRFARWDYEAGGAPIQADDLWRNGDNIFAMPARAVTVTAVFETIF
ncbi:MAG: Ig-like domain-containing protein, partial [Clostridiales bacterium]|nr:Ig-like domain-containing protein [Clostridiales bacterium]